MTDLNPLNPANPMLTTDEVAEMLAISTKTVRRLVDAGDIPAFKVGNSIRYRVGDIENALRKINTSNN